MLFDFQSYLMEMRDKAEKKETVEKYEKFYGPITGDIKDQLWYTEYVSQFKPMTYLVPEELQADFDRELLIQLVAASFSSDGMLDENNEKGQPDFVIAVQSGDQHVVKKVSELWGFQILRLYEIYIEEQMNLQILIAEDEKEKEAILGQRDSRLNRWKLVCDQEETKKLKAEAEVEKKDKLDDLYNQL
ncbi:MAG: hypothetical protein WCJ81_07985 [bacterium]